MDSPSNIVHLTKHMDSPRNIILLTNHKDSPWTLDLTYGFPWTYNHNNIIWAGGSGVLVTLHLNHAPPPCKRSSLIISSSF